MLQIRKSSCLLFLLSSAIGSVGCGGADHPPLGSVTGTVTKDGEPVSNIILFFKPDVGRAATATTDADGFYRLEYVKGVPGTKLGPTTVLLEWPVGYRDGFPIPSRYVGLTSELKLDVEKGSNVFDIEIEPDTDAVRQKAKSTVPVE